MNPVSKLNPVNKGKAFALFALFAALVAIKNKINSAINATIERGWKSPGFVAMSFVDFYTMPRRYNDDQYLAGALGMYLTYINLFVFILRLMIALQGGGRRD